MQTETKSSRLTQETQFNLLIPEPFNFQLTVRKPAGWHWSTLDEEFSAGVFHTGIYLKSIPIGLRMSSRKNRVEVSAYSEKPLSDIEISNLKSIVRTGLGGDEDLKSFYAFAGSDRVLSLAVRDLFGMRTGLLDDTFGRVILAILLQMAPLSRSQKMMVDLLQSYGQRIIFDNQQITLWPRAEELARVDENEIRDAAKLGYRAKRLKEASRFLAEHPISLLELSALSRDEALSRLLKIPGVGKYSAGIIYGTTSVPIDSWSAVIMSELLLGQTPQNPRSEIEPIVAAITKRWGNWSWFAFVYIANDLENLHKKFKLSRLT